MRHSPANLLPIEVGPHWLDEPLPHDLYNQMGVLIAGKGSIVNDPKRIEQLTRMRLYRPGERSESLPAAPLIALNQIARQYDCLRAHSLVPDVQAIPTLASALRQLVLGQPELSMAMASRMPLNSLSRRHSLQVAAVGILLAQQLGLDESTQLTVASAALSMNLTGHDLQDRLALVRGRADDADKALLRQHPWHAAEALARLGVSDVRWLLAVSQHHENLDGSGYPFGIAGSAITIEARVLRVADVWCAFLAHRHSRIGRYPRHALRELFRRERGKLDDAVMLALRRLMGYYPPGTLVRLTNRETALVTRWFPGSIRPRYVVSLLRPSGNPVGRHQVRPTLHPDYGIRDYTYLPQGHAPLDWDKVWQAA